MSKRNGVMGGRTEAAFLNWGRFVVRHRWSCIAVSILATAWCISWLPQLSIDNSTESFLHRDDPTSVRYRDFRDRFDRNDRIIVIP